MGQSYRRDGDRLLPVGQPSTGSPAGVLWAGGAFFVTLLGLGAFFVAPSASAKPQAAPPPFVATLLPGGKQTQTRQLIPPVYGQITLGAYAGEAALMAGLKSSSTRAFADPKTYASYRDAVREVYGVDLEDMNYFSLERTDLQARIKDLGKYMLLAGEYGDVTIALEPLGDEKYAVFEDAEVMGWLRAEFERAEKAGITVWVRFASEQNLRGSKYSAAGSRTKALKFYNAAVAFRATMPGNVKMVFSPLLNTAYTGRSTQDQILAWNYRGASENRPNSLWDRIGGTIYRTNLELVPVYHDYYGFMSSLDPDTDFQICEIGGPYRSKQETLEFLAMAAAGEWPKLRKVNLFARDINTRADPEGHFGFVEPNLRQTAIEQVSQTGKAQLAESFLKPVLQAN